MNHTHVNDVRKLSLPQERRLLVEIHRQTNKSGRNLLVECGVCCGMLIGASDAKGARRLAGRERTTCRLGRAPLRVREADRRTEYAIAALRRLPYREYLQTAHWHRVRTLALDRANHACALCPQTTALQVHHRTYAKKGFEQPEDLIVLCDDCHTRHHRTLALAQSKLRRVIR